MPGKFAYLKDRQQGEAEEHPAEAKTSSAPTGDAEAASEQYGRRADPTYAQINANIPAELRRRLRVKLAADERQQQEVLELLIEGYLEGRFSV